MSCVECLCYVSKQIKQLEVDFPGGGFSASHGTWSAPLSHKSPTPDKTGRRALKKNPSLGGSLRKKSRSINCFFQHQLTSTSRSNLGQHSTNTDCVSEKFPLRRGHTSASVPRAMAWSETPRFGLRYPSTTGRKFDHSVANPSGQADELQGHHQKIWGKSHAVIQNRIETKTHFN